MHSAHPGHLAFKLLDLLSLSSCFSRFSFACSLARRAFHFPLCTCLNVHARPKMHFSFFHPWMLNCLRLCLSHRILPFPPVQFSNCVTEFHISLRSTVLHLFLLFISSSWHRDKSMHMPPHLRKSHCMRSRINIFEDNWNSSYYFCLQRLHI